MEHQRCDSTRRRGIRFLSLTAHLTYQMILQMTPLLAPSELRSLRKATGLSRERFAYLIGASLPSVARWETGGTTPTGAVATLYSLLQRAVRRNADIAGIAAEGLTRGAEWFVFQISQAAMAPSSRP